MDRNSLFLGYVSTDGEPRAFFTDDADWYTFEFNEMDELLQQMKNGVSLDWEAIERENGGVEPPVQEQGENG